MNNISKFIIIGMGIVFILITIYNVIDVINKFSETAAFKIAGDPAQGGVFDPTIEFAPDSDQGYLAYAAISYLENNPMPLVGVNLAASSNSGKDWNYRKPLFESRPGSMTARENGKLVEISGSWRYEMPTLVYTPGDAGREWKVFAYRYFWNGDVNLARQTGTIAYKAAGDPAGEWTQEKWIFSANQNNPPAPYNRLVLMHVNVLSPALQDVATYADPGAYYKNGTLYVTLSAYKTGDLMAPDRMILIASQDFGGSWQYLGTVFSRNDLALMPDYTSFSGGQIFEKDGEAYLAITLGDQSFGGRATRIMKFEDMNKAKLIRGKDGAPADMGGINLNTEDLAPLGGGPADYSEQSKTGLMISRMTTARERNFVIGNFGHDFLD